MFNQEGPLLKLDQMNPSDLLAWSLGIKLILEFQSFRNLEIGIIQTRSIKSW